GVYDASGELVKTLYSGSTISGKLNSMSLDGNPLYARTDHSARVGIGVLDIGGNALIDSLGSLSGRLAWDGANTLGSLVPSGEYIIKAEESYNGERIVITKSVAVIRPQTGAYLTVSVYPNPYHPSAGSAQVTLNVSVTEESSLDVRVYNVA